MAGDLVPRGRSWPIQQQLSYQDLVLPQSLCTRCQAMRQKIQEMSVGSSEEKYPSFPVSELLFLQCGMCKILSLTFKQLLAVYSVREDIDEYRLRVGADIRDVAIELEYGPKQLTVSLAGLSVPCLYSGLSGVRLSCCSELPCPWQLLPSCSSGHGSEIRCNASLNWIRERIKHCSEAHECAPSTVTSSLPTRVIYVGTSPDDIRLVETDCTMAAAYVCLSHCWGEATPLRTTTENLAANLASLPWSKIPRTYQEAITLTRCLGIEYLWVDSLCIIQDDNADWRRESAEMCNVYEHAYLTIAATAAENAKQGLFMHAQRARFSMAGRTPEQPFRVMALGACRHPTDFPVDPSLPFWPLLQRAWVFQERLLSPRVVHFCDEEVLWECREHALCECGFMTDRTTLGKREYSKALNQEEPGRIQELWHEMVERYSLLSLSFGADKLPALAGLARQISRKRPGSRYLAGLWSDSVVADLLWLPTNATASRPITWRAPSWSWASIDGPVKLPLGMWRHSELEERRNELVSSYYTVVEVTTSPLAGDEMGGLASASLTIEGTAFPAVLTRAAADKSAEEPTERHWKLRILEGEDHLALVPTSHHAPNLGQQSEQQTTLKFARKLRAAAVSLQRRRTKKVAAQEDQDTRVLFLHPSRLEDEHQLYLDDTHAPLVDHGIDTPEAMIEETVLCVRMGRSRHIRSIPADTVIEMEYAMVLHRANDWSRYRRIGMITMKRESTEPKDIADPARMWRAGPSCLEEGGKKISVIII